MCYFRGEIAAASLKLLLSIIVLRTLLDFRGEIAAASLKLAHAPKTSILMPHFRGEIAAASLKLFNAMERTITGLGFPRRNCRGLIEATLTRTGNRPLTIISAAKLPRPH